jgi:Fe-S cluster assembly protein SufD
VTAAAIPVTATSRLPGPALTTATRAAALDALHAAGWPTRRREHWRYTNLEPLAAGDFDLSPPPAAAGTIDAVRRLLTAPIFGASTRRLVLVDGRRVPELGAADLADAEVTEPEQRWQEFERRFAAPLSAARHPLAALNTAFTERGLWLRVPARQALEPIHIVIARSPQARVAAQPRIVIELEEGAEATLVQHFVDVDEAAAGWTNSVTQVRLAEDARLVLHRWQEHAALETHTSLLAAELEPRARLEASFFDVGGKLVRNDVAIDLDGAGAQTDLYGLFLAGAGQHIDNHTTIEHSAGETVSTENFRGIIGARGRGVFNGRVVVKPDCQRIDAQQRNDNLLLGDNAEIDTKPELEIYANDVKCSHGATVGELDAEQLFYLRTRGLDLSNARRLLTSAFAATIVERVGDDALRGALLERVTARLAALTES